MRRATVLIAFVLLALAPAGAAALPNETITIRARNGPHVFRVEVAADDASRELGLMHRTHLAPDAGMLFDFGVPVMATFWMKDTPLPLDMLFVRQDGTISTVAPNAVPFSTAEIAAAEPVRVVIEINGGLAKKLGIGPGDRIQASIFPKVR
ncbi:MAG: DUF192 domain-containing protein [Rhizomicrobium sp.]